MAETVVSIGRNTFYHRRKNHSESVILLWKFIPVSEYILISVLHIGTQSKYFVPLPDIIRKSLKTT